jgi:hypothetical protein
MLAGELVCIAMLLSESIVNLLFLLAACCGRDHGSLGLEKTASEICGEYFLSKSGGG